MSSLNGKTILLGVSGSIAAYKAADLCSTLSKLGANVTVVTTESATHFIGEATLKALTGNHVFTDVFDEPIADRIAHIDLAQSADLVLVAPASANILAKLAHGLADDMLSTCLLAVPSSTPLLVAPAMNTVMWEHPATRANIAILESRGVEIVPPGEGLLACQDIGTGKLATVDQIVQAMEQRMLVEQDFAGRHILITAGATREHLDPVRFLSNRSSGKMGYALANAAVKRGANVVLVSGITNLSPPAGVECIIVETAAEMLQACQSRFTGCSLLIAAAAVSDYAPATPSTSKIKKAEGQTITITLKENPDIVATLAESKRADQKVVGFAAETEDLDLNASSKMVRKKLDMIVANDVMLPGAGFESDTNIVTVFWPDGSKLDVPKMEKLQVAHKILDLSKALFTA